jgi:hypothetical protein
MPKLPLTRIFLKGLNGKYYRVCSISHAQDFKEEPYIKVIFPDFRGKSFTRSHTAKGADAPDDVSQDSFTEITYHYKSGIRHLKKANSSLYQQKDLPKLEEKHFLDLFRYTIHRLDNFESFDAVPSDNLHFVLPTVFSEKSRILRFELVEIIKQVQFNNTEPTTVDLLGAYEIPLAKPGANCVVLDSAMKYDIPPTGIFSEVFLEDDPTHNLVEIHLPTNDIG